MKTHIRPSRPSGFALVVTLTLMILLTVIAVGLLTLSRISLRTSGQSEAMATARANARLALILALGDLQKTLGPDRAVTANSEILAGDPATPITKHNTAGVWESWWDFNPNASPDYTAEKTSRFNRWLVSNTDQEAVKVRDFVTTAWTGNTTELVGNGSLGYNAPPAAKVTAGLVPVSGGKTKGGYAWHVADESQKARINVYRDPDQNATLAQKRALLAGHRPDPSVMKGPDGTSPVFLPTDLTSDKFDDAKIASGKLLNLDQAELLKDAKGKAKQFRNDITPHSLGLLTDVRRGGLKEDLSSIFELKGNLPPEFDGKKLYASTHGITGVSDPYWSTLSEYYNTFREIENLETSPKYLVRSSGRIDDVPKGFNPAPVIAKVDMIFSLAVHPVSDVYWFDKRGGNNGVLDLYDYFVSLIYTPVVTLHNPYNVSISFHKMSVEFENVPVAFNFMFKAAGTNNFVSQSVTPGTYESINGMTGKNDRGEKKFKMTIANWTDTEPLTPSSSISKDIVMQPGQTVICGLSKPSSASFGGSNNDNMFDYQKRNEVDSTKNLTENNKALPQFTPGLGFELNGVTISNLREHILGNPNPGAPGGVGGGWCTFLMLRDSANKGGQDEFYVDFKAQVPSWHSLWDSDTLGGSTVTQKTTTPWFNVEAKLQARAGGQLADYARLRFDYNNNSTLDSFFRNKTYTYPPTKDLTGNANASPPKVTYAGQFSYQHPFAVFSASARTTNGGADDVTGSRSSANSLKDGRLAGKPFLFHNVSGGNMTMNLARDLPGAFSYELNLQAFESKGDYSTYMNIDVNRVPSLTGNTTGRGIKSGSYFEIPTGPMQTIADFRRSNALNSSYLPQFVQPVGNSSLHPMMSPSKVLESNSAISPTPLLDHSVLANHAFYDRFYFSTFATRGSEKPDSVFADFMDKSKPLPSQAFLPYRPSGQSVADAKAALFSSGKPKEESYKKAAENQLTHSPFNVNSTSVEAWKAVLASMNKIAVATLWAKSGILETTITNGVPIFGMSLLNGGLSGGPVDASKIDDAKTNEWNCYRELNDAQLTSLAAAIVNQVRLRGPFLSMSEFVNRQVGPQSDLTLSGALENAIADSGINKPFLVGNVTDLNISHFSDNQLYNYKTPAATIGNPAAGAPGWMAQGDLLRILEPGATVRSDTFVIRVLGEARDASGNVTAKAYAEAVVQRVPEYVDQVNRPSVNVYTNNNAAAVNKTFGRRMNVVSFRWLTSNEI